MLLEIENLVQYLNACKNSSPTDKGNINQTKLVFFAQDLKIFCVYFFINFYFYWYWSQMKKQFRKSFALIVTMEYQNVRASVNFCHLIIGPGMLPGLVKRPKLYSSFSGSPCMPFGSGLCLMLTQFNFAYVIYAGLTITYVRWETNVATLAPCDKNNAVKGVLTFLFCFF